MAGRKITWKKPKPRKPIKKTSRQIRIEEAINSWPSLSEGLSPQEKLKLARDIRGTGRLPRGLAHLFRPPTEDDFRALALHCCKAIIERRGSKRTDRAIVFVKLPYSYRYSWTDFPVGVLLDADMLSVTFRFNANLLLDFLHKKGYSDFCSADLRKYLGVFERKMSCWENASEEENDFALLMQFGYDSDIFRAYEQELSKLIEGEENGN